MTDVLLFNNNAAQSGTIYIDNGNLNMINVVAINNEVDVNGGIAYIGTSGNIIIDDSDFLNNRAPNGNGSAIYHVGTGSITMTNVNVTNHLSGKDSTIHMNIGPASLTKVTFINNVVEGGNGAGISVNTGMCLSIYICVHTQNECNAF